MSDPYYTFISGLIDDYLAAARKSFKMRIDTWKIDVFEKEVNEVIGGLLARQLSLTTHIAECPQAWNGHILPILLRCMADVYINFCWISADAKPRARLFIEYGLGQEKLAIEKHREAVMADGEPNTMLNKMISQRQDLLEYERRAFLIPVNLGSWNEMSVRDMAIEVGEKRFYDLVYTQFSSAVHSTWQHIWRYNLTSCENPLHMGHRLPFDPLLQPDYHLFMNSAKYYGKMLAKFDTVFLGSQAHDDAYGCYELLQKRFEQFNDQFQDENNDEKEAVDSTG